MGKDKRRPQKLLGLFMAAIQQHKFSGFRWLSAIGKLYLVIREKQLLEAASVRGRKDPRMVMRYTHLIAEKFGEEAGVIC